MESWLAYFFTYTPVLNNTMSKLVVNEFEEYVAECVVAFCSRSNTLEYRLVRSSVAVSLSESIVVGTDEEESNDEFSGMHHHCTTTD